MKIKDVQEDEGKNDWDKCIDGVTDKESLLHFMKMLINDYRENSQEWEHDSIDEYLDAMTAWVNDFSKCQYNDIDWNKIDYSVIARILYMGKIYEQYKIAPTDEKSVGVFFTKNAVIAMHRPRRR